MNRASRIFAWYSVVLAAIHLTGEMAYHFRFGQPLPGLIVDYVAVSLLCLGAWLLLARGWHAGVLCGAWGFELCLTYRSFFWRMEEIAAGTASDVTRNTAYVLGALLVLALASFACSIWLCRPACIDSGAAMRRGPR
jgi:hypothetical protein